MREVIVTPVLFLGSRDPANVSNGVSVTQAIFLFSSQGQLDQVVRIGFVLAFFRLMSNKARQPKSLSASFTYIFYRILKKHC